MESQLTSHTAHSPMSPIDLEGSFSRLDESDDKVFYETDRFISHIDDVALKTVEQIIGTLIIEENPASTHFLTVSRSRP